MTARSRTAGNLGYQTGFTDPASGLVHMGARWYTPANGQFTSRDTAHVNPVPSEAAANPFAYAAGNPLTGTDPTGHMIVAASIGGGGHYPRVTYVHLPPPHPAPPCSGFWGCLWHTATSVGHTLWHGTVNAWHHPTRFLTQALDTFLPRSWHPAIQHLLNAAGHLAHLATTKIADAAKWVYRVSGASQIVTHVTQWSTWIARHAPQILHTAFHRRPGPSAPTVNGNLVTHLGISPHGPTAGLYRDMTRNYKGGWKSFAGGIGQSMTSMLDTGMCMVSLSHCLQAQATGNTISDAYQRWLHSQGVLTSADSWFGGGIGTGNFLAAMLTLDFGGETAAADAASSATDVAPEAANTSSDAQAATRVLLNCGQSFTPGTKVLLASGAAVPIASLKVGDKVLATNVRTGKTQAEPVAAVLVHHDTNRYDLRVKTARGTSVIHTTSNHLFFDQTRGQWVKAIALRRGDHLRTPGEATVVVLHGRSPPVTTGWMWDLTVTSDHDFYVKAATTAVLAHNCDVGQEVLFGQRRVSPEFSEEGALKGRSIYAVAQDIKNGTLDPNGIRINAFWHEGQLVSENTRSLATLSLAGLRGRLI